jgi:hypothetical protein
MKRIDKEERERGEKEGPYSEHFIFFITYELAQ